MAKTHNGRCLCGSVTYEITEPIVACVNCHCESCRRQCSAPMTSYIGISDAQWSWKSAHPKTYISSPGVERTFCDHCGSPISFRSDRMSGIMHFYVASMETPEEFIPSLHVAYEEMLSWLKLDDNLPTRNGPAYL